MKIIKNMLAVLVLLLAIAAAAGYWMVHQSLPVYQGQLTAAVEQQVVSGRDAQGYLSIRAQSRGDAAFALGFAHAQERYFQMDLLRRNSAGELSELFGERALPLDISRRMHRFRDRAAAILPTLPAPQRALLQHYTQGVNEGLAQLPMRPFEYWLLQQKPQTSIW